MENPFFSISPKDEQKLNQLYSGGKSNILHVSN